MKYIILCVFIAFFSTIQAQDSNDPIISPDRTGGTVGPAKLDKGVLNLEFGANFNTYNIDNFKNKGQNYAGKCRYGLLENLEVNVGIGFARYSIDGMEKFKGFEGVSTGVKIGIADEDGAMPQIEFEGIIALPWFGNEELRPADAEPSFNFNFANTFSDRWSINYAAGMFWEGAEEVGYYGFMLIHNFTPRFVLFTEHYGNVRGDIDLEPHFGAGLMYLLNNNIQVDFSMDIGKDDDATLTFFEVGFASMLMSGQ